LSETVLITGANGFVGAGVLDHLLKTTDWNFIAPTTATHHGSQTRLNQVMRNYETHRFLRLEGRPIQDRLLLTHLDLTQPFNHTVFGKTPTPDYILNIASESHVDRSIADPRPFIRNNVDLMVNVLEYAREVDPVMVLHMSTDEVYGNAREDEYHVEWSPIRPSNPYSASKAAQEAIAYSYWRSYNVPLVITNTMNLIAPPTVTYQSTEKFVPMVIKRLLTGEDVTIHVDEDGVSGSRCWIDVRDFADAWRFLIEAFDDPPMRPLLTYYPDQLHLPPRFNVVGPEKSNRWVAETLAEKLGIDDPKLVDVNFHGSRPGHDPRYALDGTSLSMLGWNGCRPLDQTLQHIVTDYQNHPELLWDL
jgi:dTDP-glucose 4,6-dehydratase